MTATATATLSGSGRYPSMFAAVLIGVAAHVVAVAVAVKDQVNVYDGKRAQPASGSGR